MDYRMPLYIQLQDSIIKKIDEKKYLPGEAIPSERKMAEAYGVNRMTVKRAVSKLVEEGYLVCKPGSGTYVAQRDKKKIDMSFQDLCIMSSNLFFHCICHFLSLFNKNFHSILKSLKFSICICYCMLLIFRFAITDDDNLSDAITG